MPEILEGGGYHDEDGAPNPDDEAKKQLTIEYSAKCHHYVVERAQKGVTFAEMDEKKLLPKGYTKHPADKRVDRYAVFGRAVESQKEMAIKEGRIGVADCYKAIYDGASRASLSAELPALDDAYVKESYAFRQHEEAFAKSLGLTKEKVEELLDICQYSLKKKKKEESEREFDKLCQKYEIPGVNVKYDELKQLLADKRAVYEKYAKLFSELKN